MHKYHYLLLFIFPLSLHADRAPDIIETAASYIARDRLAFPGAEGMGAYAQGGEPTGKRLVVTKLEDSNEDGTLRWALNQQYPRIIQFVVGGTIELTSPINIIYSQVTIDGSTAPNGGITITGAPVYVTRVFDVILKSIRFRADGIGNKKDIVSNPPELLRITNCAYVNVAHCSFARLTGRIAAIIDSSFVTMQDSLFVEPRFPETTPFGSGVVVSNAYESSFIHNIFAVSNGIPLQMAALIPYLSDVPNKEWPQTRIEVANNVFCFYNPYAINILLGKAVAEFHIRNNEFKYYLGNLETPIWLSAANTVMVSPGERTPYVKMYLDKNRLVRNNGIVITKDWDLVRSDFNTEITQSVQSDMELFRTHNVVPSEAAGLDYLLLHNVGCNLPARDVFDKDVLNRISIIRQRTTVPTGVPNAVGSTDPWRLTDVKRFW